MGEARWGKPAESGEFVDAGLDFAGAREAIDGRLEARIDAGCGVLGRCSTQPKKALGEGVVGELELERVVDVVEVGDHATPGGEGLGAEGVLGEAKVAYAGSEFGHPGGRGPVRAPSTVGPEKGPVFGVGVGGVVLMGSRLVEEGVAGGERQGPTPHVPVARPTDWYAPFGLVTPAAWVAMFAQRYMHEFGATSEDFGRIAVADRKHAATNPKAWFYERPITLEEHQSSRWIVEPLHLLDCCQESDGAVAVVVTSVERARDLRQPPAVIAGAAQGSFHDQETMTSYYRDEIAALPEMAVVGEQLYAQSGVGPGDFQTAILYDHFTPFVLVQLEALGFCGPGEARDFIADGAIEMGGRLPLNPNGGQLGEAYIHGMNGIAEAVRQVRGSAVNQVEDVEHVVVTAGTGVPTSGLVLGRA